jgi:anti-repressor protein
MDEKTIIPLEKSDNGWVVTSVQIAKSLGVENRAVVQTAAKYLKELNEYGRVTFVMRPFETLGGIQNIKICLLNEYQATFVVSVSRNTVQAVRLKKELNDAFHYYRQKAISLPLEMSKLEWMEMCVKNEKEKKQLQITNKNLAETIETNQPIIEFVRKIKKSETSI